MRCANYIIANASWSELRKSHRELVEYLVKREGVEREVASKVALDVLRALGVEPRDLFVLVRK